MIHAFKDKVYRAVEDFNKEQDGGYKYHVVGGAAGTVSPSELHNILHNIFYIWSSFFPNPDSFSSFTYIKSNSGMDVARWSRGNCRRSSLRYVCVYVLPRRVRVPIGANDEQ